MISDFSGLAEVDGRTDAEAEMDCASSTTEVATRTSTSEMAEENASTIQSPPSPVLLSPGLHFTDFSNHLAVSLEPDFDDGSSVVTIVDPEAVSRATPGDDVYGWEAELDRKMSQQGLPVGNGPWNDTNYQFRRANGCRRSLLHRVFNLKHATRGPAEGQPSDTDDLGDTRGEEEVPL